MELELEVAAASACEGCRDPGVGALGMVVAVSIKRQPGAYVGPLRAKPEDDLFGGGLSLAWSDMEVKG